MSKKKEENLTAEEKEIKSRLGTAGGQALIEGVMMNGPKGCAMAVRHTITKKIIVKDLGKKKPSKVNKIPIIRGLVNMVSSLITGYKSLMQSADLSGSLEVEVDEEEEMSKVDKWLNDHFGPKMMGIITTVAMVLGVAIAFFLFMWLPSFLVKTCDVHLFKGVLDAHFLRPFFEGLIRVIVFVAYLAACSHMKDMYRVFQYHGAEHKTIFCYESGEELTVENVKKQRRFHPRCGTNFIFLVLIISILASSLLNVVLHNCGDVGLAIISKPLVWSLIKILIIPIVVGLGYECIKFCGKHDNALTRIICAPGLALQRITTKEPTDDMIEVGIASLKAAVFNEYPPEDDETALDNEKAEEEKDEDKAVDTQN